MNGSSIRPAPPAARVFRRPAGLDLETWELDEAWTGSGAIGPLLLMDGCGLAPRPTHVRMCADLDALWLRFDSASDDPRATLGGRDAPLWTEEVAEVFLAPGPDTPTSYAEFEVNPLGALFDARVSNPHSRREDMVVDAAWDCAGVVWGASIDREGASWSARLRIPWASLAEGPIPRVWRANFFRIDRPGGAPARFSAWSPTWTEPADFHKPDCFGSLLLDPL